MANIKYFLKMGSILHGGSDYPILPYNEHCNNPIFRTNRLFAYTLRNFVCRKPQFLSRYFVANIRPVLDNISPVLFPIGVEQSFRRSPKHVY